MSWLPSSEEELDEGRPETGIALGFLGCLPLFLAYEWGLHAAPGPTPRNAAEVVGTIALRPAGEWEGALRLVVFLGVAVAALLHLARREVSIGRGLLLRALEGLAAAILLGPILIAWVDLVEGPMLELAAGPLSSAGPSLERAARLVGGAAWEELLFRVAAYGLLFLAGRRLAGFLGVPKVPAELVGEFVGLLGSSLLFAAFHLDLVTRLVGSGGEPFDGSIFLWRLAAGMCLGLLFRWRGLAACAWAHAFFNLALVLGAGPEVLRRGA